MADSGSSASQVLAQYRRWKEDGEALRARAQSFLVERFSALIQEAQQVQHDLWEDFGQSVKFPVNPKFARKGKGRSPARKAVAAPRNSPSARPAPAPVSVPVKSGASAGAAPVTSRRTAPTASLRAPKKPGSETVDLEKKRRQLRKQIEKAEARLAQVAALGDAVKMQNAEDRLYELNDDLRLLDQSE
ncbi:MAG: hypothetical protein KIT83_02330 [Bryobacterales bacterium]|nr:hypothetical protein [Bryobacterales bacterium]